MDVRDALVQRLTKRVARMRETLDRFDDASSERERVGPNWNVRDLVGHFAYWSGEAATRITDLARGAPSKDYEVDRINDEVFRKYRRMRYVMIVPQLRSAEEQLLRAVRAVPSSMLIESEVREWVDAAIAHYDHHWDGLSNALKRLG